MVITMRRVILPELDRDGRERRRVSEWAWTVEDKATGQVMSGSNDTMAQSFVTIRAEWPGIE